MRSSFRQYGQASWSKAHFAAQRLQISSRSADGVMTARSGNAKAYEAHLRNEQRKALREAGLPEDRKTHEYTVALNGFAAELTPTEAAQLAKSDGVVNVWEDEIRHADTVGTPDYLGMTGENGVWQSQFGGDANAGKGIVVGVIDTGIDPGNPTWNLVNTPKVACAGMVSGNSTFQNNVKREAPSISAASSRSRGIARKYWVMKNTPNEPVSPGSIRPI